MRSINFLFYSESNTYSSMEDFHSLAPLFDLIDDLNNSGSSIRSIFVDCCLDSQLYQQFVKNPSFNVPSNVSHDVYLEQLNAKSCLFIPLSLRTDNLSVYFSIIRATCLLDEILFWLIKYQIPERLLKFLLILLTDAKFKSACTQSFLNIYGVFVESFLERINQSRLINISIQLFSNADLTLQAVREYSLIERILSCLYSIFSNLLIDCELQNPKENFHLVISSDDCFSRNAYHCPIISDFINILSYELLTRKFLIEKRLFITWIKIISWFQGMNVNDYEIQSKCFSLSFTMETECCAMVLRAFTNHILKPVSFQC